MAVFGPKLLRREQKLEFGGCCLPRGDACRISREHQRSDALRHERGCTASMLSQHLYCAGPELSFGQNAHARMI